MKLRLLLLALLLGISGRSYGQAVAVTMRLDTNTIPVGGSTTLRVFAQVVPGVRSNADRIFSWYVDVLNTNGSVASADYESMLKSTSDNDPLISSMGTPDGPNQRGIFDTFLTFAGAGVASPVELMSIPITGVSTGQTRFKIEAGTTVPELGYDFIVAPLGGGSEVTGGDYIAAGVNLTVVQGQTACSIVLNIARLPGGPPQRFALTFVPCPNLNHTVQYRADLNDAIGWRDLPGAPHNSGNATVTNSTLHQFYRVATSPITGLSNLRLTIATLTSPPGPQRMSITYPITAGYNYTIEFQNALVPGGPWQTLSGAPHNSGNITVTNSPSQRFYRLKATPL